MAKRPPRGFHARRAVTRSFDWDDAPDSSEPTTAASAPESRPVAQVAGHIRDQLKSDPQLNDIWIEGEVRGFSRSGSGHYYFSLADPEGDTSLACVFFRNQNHGMTLESGDQVLVHGSADLYLARGNLQIIVDDVRPIGAGVLQAEFERLLRQLNAEGLFSTDRKRPIPRYPKRIGVATSQSGAVWHDIQQVLARRWPLVELLLAPCQVQGQGAADDIARAIEQLNRLADDAPDVIIVGRGGGSAEDLWAYNEESVARAIFASEIPVISAVGHETDTTIADNVADLRAPTPSAAAELVAPDRAEELARLRGAELLMSRALDRSLSHLRTTIDAIYERLDRSVPDVGARRIDLNSLEQARDLAMDHQLQSLHSQLVANMQRLHALNPLATLERGFAAVVDEHGRIVTSATRLQANQPITIRFRDGEVDAITTRSPSIYEDSPNA